MPEVFPQQLNPMEHTHDVELTAQDRERLSLLYAEASENTEMLIGSRDQGSVEMRRRLRDEDGKVAAYIFEILNRRATIDDFESYHDICLLDLCASERDAKKIAELLVRDDIALARDRSIKGRILETLTRIGTPENADDLLSFASKCFRAPSYSNGGFQRQDAIKAFNALFAINVRTDEENENAQGRIEDAMEDIKRIVHEHTGQEINSDEEYEMGVSLLEGEIYRDFALLFEVEEPRESDDRSDSYDYFDSERNMSWENEQDCEMENDYRENKFIEIESRLETVKRLRYEVKKEKEIKEEPEDEESKFLRRHWLEYREDHPSPYTPTLGIEIEIREQSVLPPEAKQWSEGDREEFLRKMKQPYKGTEKLGVPAGKDKFWEFANAPTHYYGTLSREVQALIEMGLINPDYPRHPLHITIGGISLGVSMMELYTEDSVSIEQAADSLMPERGKETFVLARTLEATGWSTTGGRLLRPYRVKGSHNAWAVKGVGGVKERPKHQIELGMNKAVEFRTFQLQNFAGLDRTLRSAFLLGTALRAYQTEAQGAPDEVDENPFIRGELSEIWKRFSQESRRIFSTYNLSDPQSAWKAPSCTDTNDMQWENLFKKFGELIDEGRQHPQSGGAEFVAEIRGLIIATRKQVADIIYKKNSDSTEDTLFKNSTS